MSGVARSTNGAAGAELSAAGLQTGGMKAVNDSCAPAAMADLSDSLEAVSDMLVGVDSLLAGASAHDVRRSARALLGMAADMVAQARDLVQTLHR